jgi:hypothetical protein
MDSAARRVRNVQGPWQRIRCGSGTAWRIPREDQLHGSEIRCVFSGNVDIGGKVMVGVNEQAPDFELTSDTAENVRLSDFRGRKVILYFYPKALSKG